MKAEKFSLHIVIYSTLDKYGGGRETWLQYFIPNIKPYFKKIFIYSLANDDETKRIKFEMNEVVNYSLSEVNPVKYISRFIKVIYNTLHEGDIVIFMGLTTEGVASIIFRVLSWLKRKKAKTIIWIRNMGHWEIKERGKKRLVLFTLFNEILAINMADIVITNGYDTQKYFSKLTKKRVEVIPNAVEFSKFASLKYPDFKKKKLVVAYLGRFTKVKGFDYFLELAYDKELSKKYTFKAWGWGGDKSHINSFWYQGTYVVEELPSILEKTDIVLILNLTNNMKAGGISHLLLEAMAAGRLIIAWDNEVHRQVVDNTSAILVEEGNIVKLKNILISLTDETERCINARKIAEKFNVENHVNKFIQLISDVE